jgi:hypothetical protein
MFIDFSSVVRFHDRADLEVIVAAAPGCPGLSGDEELLADGACVALNRMPSRYIRREVDFAFYQSERERGEIEKQLAEEIEFAFGFVQASAAMRARN